MKKQQVAAPIGNVRAASGANVSRPHMNQEGELIARVVGGDRSAWRILFSTYGPIVERIARTNRSMGSYRGSADDVRNVMAKVFERLRRHDFRALRTFPTWLSHNQSKCFGDWLAIVTVNVIRNYISSKLGAPSATGESIKQLVNTFADELNLDSDGPILRPKVTTNETARQILDYASKHLSEDQLAALGAWIEGASNDEIAAGLQLANAREADRLLRSGLARLRRHFVQAE